MALGVPRIAVVADDREEHREIAVDNPRGEELDMYARKGNPMVGAITFPGDVVKPSSTLRAPSSNLPLLRFPPR